MGAGAQTVTDDDADAVRGRGLRPRSALRPSPPEYFTPDEAGEPVLRRGPVADWEALHALLVESFAGMEGRIDPPSSLAAMTPDALRAKAAAEVLVTLWEGEALAGCGFLKDTGRSVYLGKLAVRADLRCRGLLRRIVAEADAVARELGRPVLALQTRVELTENHAAFARLGFREVGRTVHPGYDRTTSVTMERPVPPA
jgi:GNAT superfamily N-acetyltransferase